MMIIAKVEGVKVTSTAKSLSAELLNDWLAYNADKSVATIKTYGKAVTYFLRWLSNNGIVNPQRADVIEYRKSLCATKSVATARLYIAALKVFSRWLASNGLYLDFAAGVQAPSLAEDSDTHRREALTLEEAKSVLFSFKVEKEGKKKSVKSLRDELIMRLLLNCGLRSIEIVRLDANDIERRHGKIFLRIWGKGRAGKTQRVEISKTIYDMILDYLNARGSKRIAGEPMFVSTANRNRGARLQTQTVSRLAKRVFREVGIDSPSLTCHSCRHFVASQLLLEGVELGKVQKILRHRSVSTTEIYRHDITAANNDGVLILSNLLDSAALAG